MKKYWTIYSHIFLFSLIIILSLIYLNCARYLSIEGQIDYPDTSVSLADMDVYIFTDKEYLQIEELRNKYLAYWRSVESELRDSLSNLNNKLELRKEEFYQTFDEYISNLNQLNISYLKFIDARVVDAKYYSYSWQFTLNLRNKGVDPIKGLNYSLFYEDIPLLENVSVEIELADGVWKNFEDVYVDLSSRKEEHKKMVRRYQENQREFLKRCSAVVNSVEGDFKNSLRESAAQVEYVRRKLDEAQFEWDAFPDYWNSNFEKRAVIPCNAGLKKLLNKIALARFGTKAGGKFTLENIKPDSPYYILVDGTNIARDCQWYTQFTSKENQIIYVPMNEFYYSVPPLPELDPEVPSFSPF